MNARDLAVAVWIDVRKPRLHHVYRERLMVIMPVAVEKVFVNAN
jgi:hypothetical protein